VPKAVSKFAQKPSDSAKLSKISYTEGRRGKRVEVMTVAAKVYC
jgi:hypothetical protein